MVDLHENALLITHTHAHTRTHTLTHTHARVRAACGALEQKGGWHVLWASVTGSLATGTTGKHLWLNGGHRRDLFLCLRYRAPGFQGQFARLAFPLKLCHLCIEVEDKWQQNEPEANPIFCVNLVKESLPEGQQRAAPSGRTRACLSCSPNERHMHVD